MLNELVEGLDHLEHQRRDRSTDLFDVVDLSLEALELLVLRLDNLAQLAVEDLERLDLLERETVVRGQAVRRRRGVLDTLLGFRARLVRADLGVDRRIELLRGRHARTEGKREHRARHRLEGHHEFSPRSPPDQIRLVAIERSC